MAKRLFDLCFSAIGLIVLSPLFLAIAILIKWTDSGPIFFHQQRVGRRGRPFWIWKFRTMAVGSDRIGLSVTKDRDPRVTRIGRILRKTKLDELPQLWNVFVGEMSFVGPRPEVPRYVDHYTIEQRQILELKPGITDLATLEFSREEELLASVSDVEKFYIEHCIPRKIALNRQYARQANLIQDVLLILKTICFWARPNKMSREPVL